MRLKAFQFSRLTWRNVAESVIGGALVGVAVAALALPISSHFRAQAAGDRTVSISQAQAASSVPAPARPQDEPRFADFAGEPSSPDARHVADWVADSRNNVNSDFVIVDKKYARVYVFDANSRLRAATPVLLGAAPGDHTVPGIGKRPLSEIRVEERTTPAGRFLGQRGMNALNEDVVWVDYEAAVSMHRVRATDPAERRLERLASPEVEDNRISWGCINVPADFFEAYIAPIFLQRKAPVYVLPETRAVEEVFGSYDVASFHKPHVDRVAAASATAR